MHKNLIMILFIAIISCVVLAQTNSSYNSENVQKFKKKPVKIELKNSIVYNGQIIMCRSNDFALQTVDKERIFLKYSEIKAISIRQGKVVQKNFSKAVLYTAAIIIGIWLGASGY